MTFDERKKETQEVLDKIRDRLGEDVAHAWLWSCTPFPRDLPSEEQIAEGWAVAEGGLTVGWLMAKIEDDMLAAMSAPPPREKTYEEIGADAPSTIRAFGGCGEPDPTTGRGCLEEAGHIGEHDWERWTPQAKQGE